jgi:long-chain-fatty-acyl-CoA reductase
MNEVKSETITIPKIICGEIIYPKKNDLVKKIQYEDGLIVLIPEITEQDMERIMGNREKLYDIPIENISDYLINAGKILINPTNELRKTAIDYGVKVSGYSKIMYERDFFMLGNYISERYHLYDLIEAELGSAHILDDWVRNQVAKIRAYPKGRALHILVGNVPMASILSMVRSIMTKNQTIVKIPTRDPITSTFFAMALINGNHAMSPMSPISRSISTFYLDRDSIYLQVLKRNADIVCAWGSGNSLESIKKTIPHSVPYLEFGPKRSFSVLYTANTNLKSAALKMAHDMSIYDQEACFSPQRLFIVGEHKDFIEELKICLNVMAKAMPKGKSNIDAQSYTYRIRIEACYRGWEVYIDEDNIYAIIIAKVNEAMMLKEHPLSRTLFVHPIETLDEMIPFIDEETQSVMVYPYSMAEKVANILCPYGVQRICEMGMVCYPRAGFTHDGMYPLHYFVRLSHYDEGLKYTNKYDSVEGKIAYLYEAYGKPDIDDFRGLIYD